MVNDGIGEPSDGKLKPIVDAAQSSDLAIDEIAFLAAKLGKSGETIKFDAGGLVADLASSGGPTSLSTILTPFYLVSLGFKVPKLGVPGRPAGGIDVFAQLPGFLIDPEPVRVREIVGNCGFSHFKAGDKYAPCDAKLFKYRQKVGAQDVPDLVIASLLAKKIAVGVENVGLDIRVAPFGNLGSDYEAARSNAERFNAVADSLGLKSTCFLTDSRTPYQPYIGRGEALLALRKVVEGQADPWLENHANECWEMASNLAELGGLPVSKERPGIHGILRLHLEAQGTSWSKFLEKTDKVINGHRSQLVAETNGYLKIDIERVRDVFVRENGVTHEREVFPDRIGVILSASTNQRVSEGDTIATLRFREDQSGALAKELSKIISVGEQGGEKIDLERIVG